MLIKNGFLIDPASDTERLVDLRITDGLIQKLADAGTLTPENGEDELDAAGLMISPGLVDTHIHFRDPGFTYKEDLHTGSLAAAAGGFTSVICMANTSPVIDSVPVLKELMEREALEDIHIFQAAAVSCGLKGEEMTSMKELAAAGACGFTDDGIPLKNAAFLYKAMEEAKALDLPISLHEEDPAFIETNGINHGPVSDALGIYGSPSIAEESLVARDCLLALRSGAQVVIQHISSGQSVELVRTFKAMGANLHAEATPHHFTLTDEAVLKYGALAKMNPPLRTENDRLAIIEGLKDGMKALFNNAPDLSGAIRKYIEENAGLKKQVEDFMKEKEAQLKEKLLQNIQEVNGTKVIKFCAAMIPADTVKNIAFQLRGEITENLFFVAGTVFEGKPMLTVMLSDNLVAGGLKAGNLVKEAAKLIQGGGGGQPHFATAGGKNPDGLSAAVDKVLKLAGL